MMAAASALPASLLRFTDIAVNLTDAMFSGLYHGKRVHEPDLSAVLLRAVDAGVHRIVITGTSLSESRAALELARSVNASGEHPSLRLYSTVGLHPSSTAQELGSASPPEVAAYESALLDVARDGMRDGCVVFIGECGLDFDREHYSPAPIQRLHFPMHLRLAAATGLPLFLHDRATRGELMETISSHGGIPRAGGVVHSFTGTNAELETLLVAPGEGKLYVGLNGCGLKTPENCVAAAAIPLDRLLLETDAPWCGIKASSAAISHVTSRSTPRWPTVKKEKWVPGACVKDRAEPCHILHVAEAYAGLTGTPLEAVAAAAEANADALIWGGGVSAGGAVTHSSR